MQKHGVILNMICEKLILWTGHCQHSGIRQPNRELVLAAKESLAQIQKKPYVEPQAEPNYGGPAK